MAWLKCYTISPQSKSMSAMGLASFMIADPDGNTILVDQHRL